MKVLVTSFRNQKVSTKMIHFYQDRTVRTFTDIFIYSSTDHLIYSVASKYG